MQTSKFLVLAVPIIGILLSILEYRNPRLKVKKLNTLFGTKSQSVSENKTGTIIVFLVSFSLLVIFLYDIIIRSNP